MAAHPPSTIQFAFGGPVERGDVPAICERVRILLEGSGAAVAVCDLGGLAGTDLAMLDVLARVQLIANRLGLELRLCNAPARLDELIAFAGLSAVLET